MQITKRELESIPSIKRRIARYEELLSMSLLDYPDGLKAITYDKTKVQVSTPSYSPLENDFIEWECKASMFKRRLSGYRKELYSKLNAAYNFIDSIENSEDKEIVELRCIDGKPFIAIGHIMHISKSQTCHRYHQCLKRYNIK